LSASMAASTRRPKTLVDTAGAAKRVPDCKLVLALPPTAADPGRCADKRLLRYGWSATGVGRMPAVMMAVPLPLPLPLPVELPETSRREVAGDTASGPFDSKKNGSGLFLFSSARRSRSAAAPVKSAVRALNGAATGAMPATLAPPRLLRPLMAAVVAALQLAAAARCLESCSCRQMKYPLLYEGDKRRWREGENDGNEGDGNEGDG
jgi:hypothetical protein